MKVIASLILIAAASDTDIGEYAGTAVNNENAQFVNFLGNGLPFIVKLFSQQLRLVSGRRFRNDYRFWVEIDGWIKYQEIPADWQTARLNCQLEGAVLASPINDVMRNKMVSIIPHTVKIPRIHTGINSLFSEGSFRSIEGVPLAKIPHTWAEEWQEPNVKTKKETIEMNRQGFFSLIEQTEKLPYICYRKNKNTTYLDSCGTVDSEYIFSNEIGHCYKFHKLGRTWSNAYQTCASEGGYLAIINSEAEAKYLKELFKKNPAEVIQSGWKDIAYMGFQNNFDEDENNYGEWLTIHGESLEEAGYNVWDPKQPNAKSQQRCGAIFRSAKLDDCVCNKLAPFICEKEPGSLVLMK